MSDITSKAVALGAALNFKTPPINIYPQPGQYGHIWRCDIDHGPGHHGVGGTPSEALMRASMAWQKFATRATTDPQP